MKGILENLNTSILTLNTVALKRGRSKTTWTKQGGRVVREMSNLLDIAYEVKWSTRGGVGGEKVRNLLHVVFERPQRSKD